MEVARIETGCGGPYDEQFQDAHRCAECGGRLVAATLAGRPEVVWVGCSDHTHKGFERIRGPVERYMAGEALPIHMQDGIERRLGRRRGAMTQSLARRRPEEAEALVKQAIDDRFLAELATLATERRRAVALVRLGFDPTWHLTMYRTDNGLRLIVNKEGCWWWLKDYLRGRLGDRVEDIRVIAAPIASESKADYGLTEDEIGVIARVYMPGSELPIAQGFGKASTRPYDYQRPPDGASDQQLQAARRHPDRKRNPVEAQHPYVLAEKRAEVQAIKKVAPMPGWVESAMLGQVSQETPPSGAGTTGTIIDGESRVIDDDAPPKASRRAPAPSKGEDSAGGTMPLGVAAQYEERIREAAREGLTLISYEITADAGLSPDERVTLRRLIGQRSQGMG